MISTILLNLQEILIPIVAIAFVFSIPIIAIVNYYRQKNREMDERVLMIEKGIKPPPLEQDKRKRKKSKALEDGLYLLAVGLGFFVGLWVEDMFSISRLYAIGGSILLFLGIANLCIVLLMSKEENKHEG